LSSLFVARASALRCFTLLLQTHYVSGLQAFRAGCYFKLHCLALVQRFIAAGLNGGKVNEHILSGFALNESVTLAGIEPLHGTLFSHGIYLTCSKSYLVPLIRYLGGIQQKGCESDLAALQEKTGIAKASNASAILSQAGDLFATSQFILLAIL